LVVDEDTDFDLKSNDNEYHLKNVRMKFWIWKFIILLTIFILLIGENSSVGRVKNLFPSPFFLNVLVYAHASVGVFTRTPIYLSFLVDSTFLWIENLWMPGCISQA
jgi:hypothetical protein